MAKTTQKQNERAQIKLEKIRDKINALINQIDTVAKTIRGTQELNNIQCEIYEQSESLVTIQSDLTYIVGELNEQY